MYRNRLLVHCGVLIGAFAGLLLLGGCSDNSRPSETGELEFQIQDSLLSASVLVKWADINFRPPRSFGKADSSTQKLFQQILSEQFGDPDDVPYSLETEHVFLDHESGAALAVSSVRSEDPTSAIWQPYTEQLKTSLGTSAVSDTFVKDALFFEQYLIRTPNRIQFKLLTQIDTNSALQFDFIIPQDVYPATIRSIESSIGSIILSPSRT